MRKNRKKSDGKSLRSRSTGCLFAANTNPVGKSHDSPTEWEKEQI